MSQNKTPLLTPPSTKSEPSFKKSDISSDALDAVRYAFPEKGTYKFMGMDVAVGWNATAIYGQATVHLPSGIQGTNLGEPIFDEEFEHLSITPKLIETVKSGSRQADALIKQKTALTSKALSQWFGQLDIQMENQYRYRCMCPSPKCRKAVEFFSYKTQDVINLNDVPKCGECDGK